ncbi:MAG TPA: 2-oxoacid:ferredoxin oxidoreductase subunit gamma [Dehalococcoidia bacterium]|nr:2-oxoacid:ferredoxin oxidoreductase subunit gamma [Dehalococcoidia bacterium]
MLEEIVISGFGGQGLLVIGRLLADAGMIEDRNVVWLPSYGAEKRGGTCSCHITISNEKIGALYIKRPTAAIVMSPSALTRLEPLVKSDGILVINSSLIADKVGRNDIRTVYVPANELAAEVKDDSVANLVVLGALIAHQPITARASIITAINTLFSKSGTMLEANTKAFLKGYTQE